MNQIESYYISKSEYGIITLIVNTVDKWLNYDYSDGNDTFNLILINEENEVLEIKCISNEEFLFDIEKEFNYRRLEQQDKDQIVFYWIPLRFFKGDEYVEHLKKKK